MQNQSMQELISQNFYKQPEQEDKPEDLPLHPSVQAVADQFPSLVVPKENSEEEDDFSDEYVKNNTTDSKETKESKKRLTQNERLRKKLQELELEKSQYKRQAEEALLLREQTKLSNLEERYSKTEILEKNIDDKIDELSLFKRSYDAENDHENSMKMEKQIRDLNNELIRIKQEKSSIANNYQSNKNQFDSAYQEYQARANSYTPTDNFEFDDHGEAKKKNLNDFISKHPYLDGNGQNQNYSPRAFAIAQDLSTKIEDLYKINGQGNLVGSKQYFKDLSEAIKTNLESSLDIGNNMTNKNFSAPVSTSRRTSVQFNAKPSSEEEKIKRQFLNKLGKEHAPAYENIFANLKKGSF